MQSLFINGTVGVGKSSAAEALAECLAGRGVAHALIDLDAIRRCWPAPADDPFNLALELRNLAALAANYRAAGAQRLILAGVIERRADLARYRDALGGSRLSLCRLQASPETLAARLRIRHASDLQGLAWHLRRSAELDAILREAALDDLVVETDRIAVDAVAQALLAACAW
ncbi:TPA: AAA family ATPase [Pseudomonas aeruginosa]|nr:AAA family ATPase [Pseudomonas aeruginosa]